MVACLTCNALIRRIQMRRATRLHTTIRTIAAVVVLFAAAQTAEGAKSGTATCMDYCWDLWGFDEQGTVCGQDNVCRFDGCAEVITPGQPTTYHCQTECGPGTCV